jgi:hypothetical protein
MNADVFHVLEQTGVWKFNIAIIDYTEFDEFKNNNPEVKFEFFDRFDVDEEDTDLLIKSEDEYYDNIFKIK